jgi:3-dehydroquinate synthase
MIEVRQAGGSYPVLVEPGILERLPELVATHLPGRRTALLTDETVSELYGRYLAGTNPAWGARPRTCADGSPAGWRERFTFPAGERSKTRETWAALTDQLIQSGHGAGSGIVALGGGVTGDLAGFVAATLGRGVPIVQVPTTLLAMVDASIGGKTGVNTTRAKNLIGALHPPAAVIADPLVLGTLPAEQFRGGLAEAVKHALMADGEYLAWLLAGADAILGRDPVLLAQLIERSVVIKARIVSADERDSGERAVLNAGHTVAHALEQVSDYAIPHGDAVALGLVAETALAERLGVAQAGLSARIGAALGRFGLPTALAAPLPAGPLIAAMHADKKSRAGEIRFALPAALGRPARAGDCWTTAAPEVEIVAALAVIGAR